MRANKRFIYLSSKSVLDCPLWYNAARSYNFIFLVNSRDVVLPEKGTGEALPGKGSCSWFHAVFSPLASVGHLPVAHMQEVLWNSFSSSFCSQSQSWFHLFQPLPGDTVVGRASCLPVTAWDPSSPIRDSGLWSCSIPGQPREHVCRQVVCSCTVFSEA